jgi:hypothetical protein
MNEWEKRRNYYDLIGGGGMDHGAKPTALGRHYDKPWQKRV